MLCTKHCFFPYNAVFYKQKFSLPLDIPLCEVLAYLFLDFLASADNTRQQFFTFWMLSRFLQLILGIFTLLNQFLSIRSGFLWGWFEKIQIFWQNRLHFCGIINWFLSIHIILNMFLREKDVLLTTYIDYLIETLITVNWMVGIDKGKYT